MAKLAITAAIALLSVSAIAQAGGHTDAEAQIEKLLQDKKILATRLSNAIAFSKERAAQLEAASGKQMAMSAGITSAIAQSKKKAAQMSMLQQQLDAEKNKSKALGSRLSNAIAFSKERAAQLEAANRKQMAMSAGIAGALAQSKRKAAQMRVLQHQVDSENNKSKALGGRLSNAIAFSKERATQISALQQQLDSEKSKSKALGSRLRNAIAFSKERATQVDSQQRLQSDWAASVRANLDAAIGGVQGTTVIANNDNSVNVQVGNNGLFSTGGIALSAGGFRLLSTIAQQLSALDANFTVVGHTDNVPVGDNRRFSSNEELSLARAVSTLQFLRDQGIQTEQLSAAGYGAGNPVRGNDTEEGRAQNRRVEIVLRKQ